MSSQAKILIIEDDRDMAEALRIILEGKSYNIKLAFDGKQGLNIIRKENPDLIILDLLLPGENGATICHTLKSSSKYQNIPILILTALTKKVESKIFPHQEEKSLEADEYLDKPVDPESLIEKVKKLLKR